MSLTKNQMYFLQDTRDILIGYDGYNTVDDLKGLIAETYTRLNHLIQAVNEQNDNPEDYIIRFNPAKIIVNAKEQLFNKEEISYKDISEIVYGKVIDALTVTFSYGRNERIVGLHKKSAPIFVKDGMLINVSLTTNA